MNIKDTLLTSASVLVLSAGLGAADPAGPAASGNVAYIGQNGNDNEMLIDQASTTESRAGRFAQPVQQDGDDNRLRLRQRGSENRFGSNAAGTFGEARQDGSFNLLEVLQDGSRNQFTVILQLAPNGLSAPANKADIEQSGNFGNIGTITQTSAVPDALDANILSVTQKNGSSIRLTTVEQLFTGAAGDIGNSMTIMQDGPTGNITEARQIGFQNNMELTQTGRTNLIRSAIQDGSMNSAIVTMTGDFNNRADSDFTGDALFAAGGLEPGIVRQTGVANILNMAVNGNDNLFTLISDDGGNTIDGFVEGNFNQAVVFQTGGDNSAVFTQTGNNNNLGIIQGGGSP